MTSKYWDKRRAKEQEEKENNKCYKQLQPMVKIMKRQPHSKETKDKIGKANSGKNNGMWRGNEAGRVPLHIWIRKHKLKPEFCEVCNKKEPYDIANIKNHQYTRNSDDYKWLCRSCHMKSDGRINNLIQFQGKHCFVCNREIKNLKGTVKSDNKIYCSLNCLNKDITKK